MLGHINISFITLRQMIMIFCYISVFDLTVFLQIFLFTKTLILIKNKGWKTLSQWKNYETLSTFFIEKETIEKVKNKSQSSGSKQAEVTKPLIVKMPGLVKSPKTNKESQVSNCTS